MFTTIYDDDRHDLPTIINTQRIYLKKKSEANVLKSLNVLFKSMYLFIYLYMCVCACVYNI